MTLLLTLRPVELWTPLEIGLSLALLAVVVVGIAWGLSVATTRYDREP